MRSHCRFPGLPIGSPTYSCMASRLSRAGYLAAAGPSANARSTFAVTWLTTAGEHPAVLGRHDVGRDRRIALVTGADQRGLRVGSRPVTPVAGNERVVLPVQGITQVTGLVADDQPVAADRGGRQPDPPEQGVGPQKRQVDARIAGRGHVRAFGRGPVLVVAAGDQGAGPADGRAAVPTAIAGGLPSRRTSRAGTRSPGSPRLRTTRTTERTPRSARWTRPRNPRSRTAHRSGGSPSAGPPAVSSPAPRGGEAPSMPG